MSDSDQIPMPVPVGEARADRGSPYPISQQDLDILQARVIPPHSPFHRPYLTWSITHEEALATLFAPNAISQTPKYRAAAARLKASQHLPRTRDYLIKIANDLDILLFHQALRHRFSLTWAIFPPAIVRAAGVTVPPVPGVVSRIAIFLSVNFDWAAEGRDKPISVLVHEMLHAFFIVCCGGTKERRVSRGYDAHHGDCFVAAARRIEVVTGWNLIPGEENYRGRRR